MVEVDEQNALSARLKTLREREGLTLDRLATRCGISRATLSRFESGASSPTVAQLTALSRAYGLTAARLLAETEGRFQAHVRRAAQAEWSDGEGNTARAVSPPARTLLGHVAAWHLAAGARVHYASPVEPFVEQHLLLRDGSLRLTLTDTVYELTVGDCVRYRAAGSVTFEAGAERGATYDLFTVRR